MRAGGPGLAARALALPVRLYRRAVSPLLPPRCRFSPTCSSYALEALHVHGALRGSWLALRRLARCQPFSPGGPDPVPAPRLRGRAHPAARPTRGDAPAGTSENGRAPQPGTAAGPPDPRPARPPHTPPSPPVPQPWSPSCST